MRNKIGIFSGAGGDCYGKFLFLSRRSYNFELLSGPRHLQGNLGSHFRRQQIFLIYYI